MRSTNRLATGSGGIDHTSLVTRTLRLVDIPQRQRQQPDIPQATDFHKETTSGDDCA
jgi:hypothetical protein